MEVSEHIVRLNKIIKALTDEIHLLNNEGHLPETGEHWGLLNDIELDLQELRTYILEETK